MSFLNILREVWGDGARLFYAALKAWLAPAALNRTDSTSMLLLTGSEKFDGLLAVTSQALAFGRLRPVWMTHGINDSHSYESHTEPFPHLPVLGAAECEAAVMHAAHAQAGLLHAPFPTFTPNHTPIDGTSAARVAIRQNQDIFIHEAEARDALRTALHFAAGKTESRYQHSHPAFTSPKTPWIPYSSPLAGEMIKYIGSTYLGSRHSIRVAPPSQIRLELETCLLLAFAPYVLSDAFRNDDGKNTIVPEYVHSVLERGASGDPLSTREIITLCEEGFIDDGEDLLKLWAAWRWVVKAFVGILVLRDRDRQRYEIVWV